MKNKILNLTYEFMMITKIGGPQILKKITFLFLSLIFPVICLSQKSNSDSLEAKLKISREDTNKINLLYKLAVKNYSESDFEKALLYLNQDIVLSQKLGIKKSEASALNTKGAIYYYKADYAEALKNYEASLKIRQELGDKDGIASSYNNMAFIFFITGNLPEAEKYYNSSIKINEASNNYKQLGEPYNGIAELYKSKGNYPEALRYHFLALKAREKTGKMDRVAGSYNNIGILYYHLGNYEEALKNYNASLQIVKQIGNKRQLAEVYQNMAAVFSRKGDSIKELEYHEMSLKINTEQGNKRGLANDYAGLAAFYSNHNDFKKGIMYQEMVVKMAEESNDKIQLPSSYNVLGQIKMSMKRFAEAKKDLEKGLALGKELRIVTDMRVSHMSLAMLDSINGDFKQALEHYRLYISYRDSLINDENTKKSVQTQMQYDFDKKESATKAEQDKKDAIAKEEKEKQVIVRNSFIVGFALVFVLAILIFTGYRNKKKANLVIIKQKEEVEKAKEIIEAQKELVEEKQKEILDSIYYARRIQVALITNEKYIERVLNEKK